MAKKEEVVEQETLGDVAFKEMEDAAEIIKTLRNRVNVPRSDCTYNRDTNSYEEPDRSELKLTAILTYLNEELSEEKTGRQEGWSACWKAREEIVVLKEKITELQHALSILAVQMTGLEPELLDKPEDGE